MTLKQKAPYSPLLCNDRHAPATVRSEQGLINHSVAVSFGGREVQAGVAQRPPRTWRQRFDHQASMRAELPCLACLSLFS